MFYRETDESVQMPATPVAAARVAVQRSQRVPTEDKVSNNSFNLLSDYKYPNMQVNDVPLQFCTVIIVHCFILY